VAIVLALAGNVYFLFANARLTKTAEQLRDSLAAESAKLNDNATAVADNRQRIETLSEEAQKSVADALDQARSEARRSSARVATSLGAKLDLEQQQRQQVAGQVAELQDATTTESSKINEVSGDVTNVKADVAATQSKLEATGSDLKRVMGDMGVMSGLVATNSSGLAELRTLGERNYVEFDIRKTPAPSKVGDISISIRKTDPKRNRFTITVVADDKIVEKRDRTINEPVQFYVARNRQPYEIVVNEVKKDEVVGYLATPKINVARR
jgi:uncharacterized phage infection (PIP) family protein YhgE